VTVVLSIMREIVFALRFRGTAGPVPGHEQRRRARSEAPSQMLRTVLGPAGIDAAMEPVAGESAVLESEVERFGDGTFMEAGTIRYGRSGKVTFETIGLGTVRLAPRDGWVIGGVTWKITGGDGVFADAQGLITSNFTVSAGGEVVDDHVVRLYLP
jgi:hypothetical protein